MFSKVNYTLGVQEVVNQHVVATLVLDRLVLEEFLMNRWTDAHVFLGKRADMSVDVVGVL